MSSNLVQDKNNEYGKSKDGLVNFFKVKNKVDEQEQDKKELAMTNATQLRYTATKT